MHRLTKKVSSSRHPNNVRQAKHLTFPVGPVTEVREWKRGDYLLDRGTPTVQIQDDGHF